VDALGTTQEEGQRPKLRVYEKEEMRTCVSEAGSNGEGGGEYTVLILITN
jgi:hypothetical protein